MVGLDGACMDLIKPWAEQGKLPTFKRLISEGSYGNLESIIPALTIPAWNCLATGKNPGKIGCFGFVQKSSGSYDFRFPAFLIEKERDIWDILSDYGKEVFILNAPNAPHAYSINGCMVAGFFCTSEERLTYPSNLRDELYEMDYESDIGDLIKLKIFTDREYSIRHKEITEKHCKVLSRLMGKNWEFGFFVLTELDRIQHRFWDRKDILLDHYQNIDGKLKEILKKLDEEDNETTVIIVSDHGFGPNKRVFYINEWLIKEGLLKVERVASLDLMKGLISIGKRRGMLKMLRPLMKITPFRRLHVSLFSQTGRIPIIWSETKAFSYGTWGAIYINLRGREPQGIVSEEDYEQLRKEIIEGLEEISVKAYRREELYHGKYLDFAPDIIIQTDDNVSHISGRVGYGNEFLEGFGGAHHELNGTFIARGPDIKGSNEIKARMYDIAPTILHIFGFPIPEEMDGWVLKELFVGELAAREIKYQGLEERERIAQKLRGLKKRGEI